MLRFVFGPFIGKPTSPCSWMRLRKRCSLASAGSSRGMGHPPPPPWPPARHRDSAPRPPQGVRTACASTVATICLWPLAVSGAVVNGHRIRAAVRHVESGGGRTRGLTATRARGGAASSARAAWFRPRRARRRHALLVSARCNVGDDGGSRVPRRRRAWDSVARFRVQKSCALWFEPAVASPRRAGRPSSRRAPEAPRPARGSGRPGHHRCGHSVLSHLTGVGGWLLTWPTEQGLGSEDGFCRVPATWLWPAEFELAKSVLHAQATADKTGPVYPAGREPPGEGLARPCSHGDSGMGRVPTGSPDASDRSLRRLFRGCSEG